MEIRKNGYKVCLQIGLVLLVNLHASAQNSKGRPLAQISEQASIDTLTARLTRKYLAEPVNAIIVNNCILPDGSWKDINYGDSVNVNWMNHLTRLKLMAIAFKSSKNPLYHNNALLHNIEQGFEYCYSRQFKSWNWWDLTIGAPNTYMVALILMKHEISKEKLVKYAGFLKNATDNRSHQGENRLWVSTITLHKGCIEDNFQLANKGFLSIASTLVIQHIQGAEGIKIDNSFHQHRPQLYSGGYGMGYAKGLAEVMAVAVSTLFEDAFTPEKKDIYTKMVLSGHQLFSYRNVIDFGTIGRDISRPNAMGTVDTATLNELIVIDAKHAADYKQWKANLVGGAYPELYRGNKYFWNSDIMTQHGADYYLSAKVTSTRSAGTEMLNGENLKGYNLPLGSTNIMTTGLEYRNIFPVWDWTKVPGTTAVNNQSSTLLQWYLYGSNVFAGGVSDQKKGVIAYEHSYNGVQAKKAYFFMGDALLCLGAGVNALGVQTVTTTVNQCMLQGDVTIGHQNTSGSLTADKETFNDLQWVYHNGVGYLFPEKQKLIVSKATQVGNWRNISTASKDSVIKTKVFSLWFDHGTAPTNERYSYIVFPAKTLDKFKDIVRELDFNIVSNTPDIQSIRYKNYAAIVFYNSGSIDLGEGLTVISANKALVMLEISSHGYTISVSDPLHTLSIIKLSLNKAIAGRGVTNNQGNSTIVFNLPTGDMVGSTVSRNVTFK